VAWRKLARIFMSRQSYVFKSLWPFSNPLWQRNQLMLLHVENWASNCVLGSALYGMECCIINWLGEPVFRCKTIGLFFIVYSHVIAIKFAKCFSAKRTDVKKSVKEKRKYCSESLENLCEIACCKKRLYETI